MSPSPDRPADKIATIERFDPRAGLRNALRHVAEEKGQWAGIPMPIEEIPLIIEPNYPNGQELAKIGQTDKEPLPDGIAERNTFYSHHARCDIVIWNEPDGRIRHGYVPAFHSLGHALSTLGASAAWGIEQEHNALQLLGTLITHHQMRQYLLTGAFLETSRRSGLTYMFRKLRPTVVLDNRRARPRVMCALCMHPIGYYSGSWAGAMCPTDDVIAHLMLMRGDEPMLWRRCNQHAPHRPEAGL